MWSPLRSPSWEVDGCQTLVNVAIEDSIPCPHDAAGAALVVVRGPGIGDDCIAGLYTTYLDRLGRALTLA